MAKRSFTDIFAFQTPISLSVLLMFLGLLFGAVFFNSWILVFSLLAAIVFILYDHYAYLKAGHTFSRSDVKTIKALIVTYGLLALSFICSAIRIIVTDCFYFAVVCLFVAFFVVLSLLVFELLYLRRVALPACNEPREKLTVKAFLPITVIAILIVVLNIEIFDTWFRWDSYDYYYYFQNISYTELNQYSNLRPANHAAYGGSIMFLIVDGIIGNAAASLYLINILMLVVGAFAFWRMIGILFPNWSVAAKTATTTALAFTPFLFGLAWSISLETYLSFGLIMFFWGRVEKLPVLQVVAALIICFSKETGAVLLAAIILTRLILNFVLPSGKEKTFWQKLDLPVSLPILGFGLAWLGEFLLNSWTSSNTKYISTAVDVKFNNFNFNKVYILDRLKSLIFTNFTWLLLTVVIIGFTVGLIRKYIKKHAKDPSKDSEDKIYYTVELLAGFVASLVPLFLFVTYNHVRYASPTVVLTILLLPVALNMMTGKDVIKSIVSGAVAACFLAQSYLTIDPMMKLMYNKINKGHGYITYTENNVLENTKNTSASISVSAQYNRELMYFDEAFDQVIGQVGYTENTIILFPGEFKEPTVGGFVYSEYLICGYGYRQQTKVRYISWDSENNTRFLSKDKDHELLYRTVNTANDLKNSVMKTSDRCVYIQLPFCNMERQTEMFNGFTVTEVGRSNIGGWELVAYEITMPAVEEPTQKDDISIPTTYGVTEKDDTATPPDSWFD